MSAPAPIAYQAQHFAVQLWQPQQFVTAHEWTHGRDGNVNPVLHARFATPEGSLVDAYAKPFNPASLHDSTVALNEATGWILARACGLPVPERAFFTALHVSELPLYDNGSSPLPPADQNGRVLAFATQAVGNTAVRGFFDLDALLKEQRQWERCDDTIAFDEALANPDRHAYNLIRRGPRDFVLIDHGFLLRQNTSSYPEHWQDGALERMVSTSVDNRLHISAYLQLSRTALDLCMEACEACEQFMHSHNLQLHQAFFEISYWCSKLLPGRSAQWLNFLHNRVTAANLSQLLQRRFGLLPLHV